MAHGQLLPVVVAVQGCNRPASSVDSEVVLFNGTTGKAIKAATITGIPKLTSGVISAATAGTDYVKPDTATNFTATQRPDYGTTSISTTSTHTFDGADQIREITLTNTITVTFGAPTGITQYAMYKFILKAGDANTRTYSWNAAYKFPSAVAPLTSGTVTSGAFDIITFIGGASNTLIFEGCLGMFGNSGGGAGAGDGSKSLRFRNGAYMTRTPGTAGDQSKWTFSAWIKNGGPSAYNCVLRRALRTRSTITTLGHISSAAGKLRLKSETLPDLQGWRSRIHTYQTRQIFITLSAFLILPMPPQMTG